MPKSRIPSPARSQGVISTPRRQKSRGSRSVCSPATSTASGRLTSVIDQFKEKNLDSFALSPLNSRRSVLSDNTDIEEPRRKSWWKNLKENSTDIMDVLVDDKVVDPVNAIEDIVDVEILSQEKKNYTLDLPESSDNESVNSIVLPQRKLFTFKENQPQNKFGELVGGRETLAKLHKTNNDKTINAGTRDLFQGPKRSKPIFPAALLNISPDKTAIDKTKENIAAESKVPTRNIFGARPANKRKNIFADFIVSESEDEISEIQPKVFGFQKKVDQRRISSASKGRDPSPTSSITMELDDWRQLPSSTLVEHQLDEIITGTPVKRARLSKLSEAKESEAGTTVDKTKQSSPSTPVTRGRLSKQLEEKESDIDTNIPETNQNKSLSSTPLTRSRLSKQLDSSKEANISKSGNKSKQANKSISTTPLTRSRLSKQAETKDPETAVNNCKAVDKTKENNKSISSTPVTRARLSQQLEAKESETVADNSKSVDKTKQSKKSLSKSKTSPAKATVIDEVVNDNVNTEDDDENNFTLEYENDDQIADEADVQNAPNTTQSKQKPANDENETIIRNKDNFALQEDKEARSKDAVIDKNVSQTVVNTQESKNNTTQPRQTGEDETRATKETTEREVLDEQAETNDNQNITKNKTATNISQHIESPDNKETEINKVQGEVNQEIETEITEECEMDANIHESREMYESKEHPSKQDKVNESHVDNEEDDSQEEANSSQNADTSQAEGNAEEENECQEQEVNQSQEDEGVDQSIENNEDEEENENTRDVSNNESEDESQEIERTDNASQEEQEDSENEESENEAEVNESEAEVNESEAEVNESQEVENDNQSDDEEMENSADDRAIATDDMSEEEQEEMEEDDDDSNKIEADVISEEVIEESPNVTHDTTGRNRKKVKSPEAILHDKTNLEDSFTAKGRNTSIRKTKSMYKDVNIRPSLAPPRDSLGLSDGTRDSSAEGSGWDSHRTTRKTLRQTFGKDFTLRKSLRALVMEKAAKQTEHIETNNVDTSKIPLANSTEYLEDFNNEENVTVESDHEVSRRTRQTTLETYLQKMKQQNMEKKVKMEEAIRNTLNAPPPRDPLNVFKVPTKPVRKAKPAASKPKKNNMHTFFQGELPPEIVEDMKYKPPKRFQPNKASWITKRLYKYLEKKLEPKYDYKARVRAEKLMETIFFFVKDIRRHDVANPDAVELLKHEMARLDIVKTHFEFYEFFHEFMPREVRVKVIPDVVNNIALPRRGVFSEIIR